MDPVPDPQRAEPVVFTKEAGGPGPDVGEFRQGTPASRWALARYLVGRAVVESVGWTLYLIALAVIAVAVAEQLTLHWTFLTVLLAIVALVVLVLRWALLAIVRRLTAFGRYGPVEERLRTLVGDTRDDTLRELRRLGLPSHMVTLPLLAVRLVGARRKDTLTRLAQFDLDHAVPPARLDELHLMLRELGVTRGTPR